MSRTFAVEVQISQNGTQLKKISEGIPCTGDNKDVSTMLVVLEKTKECSNEFLTSLVQADKNVTADIGGAVVSHSKRKNEDDVHGAKRLACAEGAPSNDSEDDDNGDVAM